MKRDFILNFCTFEQIGFRIIDFVVYIDVTNSSSLLDNTFNFAQIHKTRIFVLNWVFPKAVLVPFPVERKETTPKTMIQTLFIFIALNKCELRITRNF